MSMKTVTAYRFDANGYYVGPVEVLYDTQKNKALLPPDCVLCEPLGSGPWRINQAKNGWDCVKPVSELDPLELLSVAGDNTARNKDAYTRIMYGGWDNYGICQEKCHINGKEVLTTFLISSPNAGEILKLNKLKDALQECLDNLYQAFMRAAIVNDKAAGDKASRYYSALAEATTVEEISELVTMATMQRRPVTPAEELIDLEISKLAGSEKQKSDRYAQRLEQIKEALISRAKYRAALCGGSSLAKGGGHAD